MTKAERDLIVEHGPYTLRADGVLLDDNGFALASMRPTVGAVETAWDRAVVAALNDVCGKPCQHPNDRSVAKHADERDPPLWCPDCGAVRLSGSLMWVQPR